MNGGSNGSTTTTHTTHTTTTNGANGGANGQASVDAGLSVNGNGGANGSTSHTVTTTTSGSNGLTVGDVVSAPFNAVSNLVNGAVNGVQSLVQSSFNPFGWTTSTNNAYLRSQLMRVYEANLNKNGNAATALNSLWTSLQSETSNTGKAQDALVGFLLQSMVNKGFVTSSSTNVTLNDWLQYLNDNVNVQQVLNWWSAREEDDDVSNDDKKQYALLGAFLQDLVDSN